MNKQYSDNNFVTATILGGLGNQLFQIFTTISYAIDNNCQFVFPNHKELEHGENMTARYTYWDSFLKDLQSNLNNENDIHYQIKYMESSDGTYTKFPDVGNVLGVKETRPTTMPTDTTLSQETEIYTKGLRLKQNTINSSGLHNEVRPNVSLFGYFQSFKYFEHNYNKITELINLKNQKQEILNIFESIPNNSDFFKNTISLHFRLSDYVKYQNYFVLLDDNYYVDSLQTIIKNRNTQFKVIYFCEEEDTDLVTTRIENIIKILNSRGIHNCVFYQYPSILEDWQQMLLMSLCEHNIIANSSFSWWGAYFNENQNKIVCYPSRYYATGVNKNTSDLYPENWTMINV